MTRDGFPPPGGGPADKDDEQMFNERKETGYAEPLAGIRQKTLVAHSGQIGHRFRDKSATDSGINRPLIPG